MLAVHLGDCLDEVIYSVLGAVSTSFLASLLVPILALLVSSALSSSFTLIFVLILWPILASLVSSALSSSFTLIFALILWPILVSLVSPVWVWAIAEAAVSLVGVSGWMRGKPSGVLAVGWGSLVA